MGVLIVNAAGLWCACVCVCVCVDARAPCGMTRGGNIILRYIFWNWLSLKAMNGTDFENERLMGLTVRASSECNWLFGSSIIASLLIIGAKTSCLAATVLVLDQERHKMSILFSSLPNILLAKWFNVFPVRKCNICYVCWCSHNMFFVANIKVTCIMMVLPQEIHFCSVQF